MEALKELIEAGIENDIVDFKIKFYLAEKKYDLLKDVLSFANNCSNKDKYIIFGYDNIINQFQDVNYADIEDISNYIQLINEYCDPFIDVLLNKFEYNGNQLAYLQIKNSNKSNPYLVKKDFKRGDKTFLRKGEIYIRKNANNFIAEKDDIELMFEMRKKIILAVENTDISIVTIKNGMALKSKFNLLLKIINNTSSTISYNKGKVVFKYDRNCFETDIENIEDYSQDYKKELNSIATQPFVIGKETQTLKSIIFNLSDGVHKIIKDKFETNEKPIVTIKLIDLLGKEYKTNFVLSSIY